MPVISSRISGWRVIDSMTLPKMMPMPTPAPTAPRPPPTPRAIALPASAPSSAAAKMTVRNVASTEGSPLGLVVLGDRAAEVDGREGGEDERLQGRHQPDLEEEDRDAGRDDDDPERLDPEQHGEPAGHEQDDQVAGEDVGEETYGERDQPHEVREELEHEDEALHERVVDAGRDQARQVAADALRADALHVVGDEHHEREHQRKREGRRRGVQRERRDLRAEDVHLLVR